MYHCNAVCAINPACRHGGAEVSRHCARVLHTHLRNQLLMPFKSQQPALAGGDLHMGDPRPQLDAVTHAFREAYRQTDLELAATPSGRMAGSTAVSVLLGPTCVWAANCGRSLVAHPRPSLVRGFEQQQAPKRKKQILLWPEIISLLLSYELLITASS